MVNGLKPKVSRMAREFSQTVVAEEGQVCQPDRNCHSLVPGMSQYGDSPDFYEMSHTDDHDATVDFGKEEDDQAAQVHAAIQRSEPFELSL